MNSDEQTLTEWLLTDSLLQFLQLGQAPLVAGFFDQFRCLRYVELRWELSVFIDPAIK
ncbi:MAG: hypothetical protein IPH22_06500 [Nitrosomonas sp.]|nr:hypothetical protein [Nitrosomonas sp.]